MSVRGEGVVQLFRFSRDACCDQTLEAVARQERRGAIASRCTGWERRRGTHCGRRLEQRAECDSRERTAFPMVRTSCGHTGQQAIGVEGQDHRRLNSDGTALHPAPSSPRLDEDDEPGPVRRCHRERSARNDVRPRRGGRHAGPSGPSTGTGRRRGGATHHRDHRVAAGRLLPDPDRWQRRRPGA